LVLVMVALFLQSKRKDDNIMFAHYISIYIVSIGPLELKLPPNYDLGGIIVWKIGSSRSGSVGDVLHCLGWTLEYVSDREI
jgi:hypothetical protein